MPASSHLLRLTALGIAIVVGLVLQSHRAEARDIQILTVAGAVTPSC